MLAETGPNDYSDALLTDLYQLTMAFGYWRSGLMDREAVFHLTFRHNPFGNGYSIACGLTQAMDFLRRFHFTQSDTNYLAQLSGNDGKPLFSTPFLDSLEKMRFSCDVDAVPEGTVVFPHEPLIRVRGPLIQAQIVETPLLNMINFQTLIATKAARICQAAASEPVLEFGLRRAQGVDGALAASRAAYIGGCTATSNLLAGKRFGIPVRGTHAHSWVMAFDTEQEALQAWANAMPNNVVLLVDTYNTIEGIRQAIEVGRRLRTAGRELAGVRLDSGDLADLSIKARRLLDEAGFHRTPIVATGDLDEEAIADLKQRGAPIAIWGVGTRLATGYDEPALGGVYKLSAIRRPGRTWEYKIKLSEQVTKTTTPGIHQVRRFRIGSTFLADAIFDEPTGIEPNCAIIDPAKHGQRQKIETACPFTDLLQPVFRNGICVYDPPSIDQSRRFTQDQLAALPDGVRRLKDAERYPVGLEARLYEITNRIMQQAKGVHQ